VDGSTSQIMPARLSGSRHPTGQQPINLLHVRQRHRHVRILAERRRRQTSRGDSRLGFYDQSCASAHDAARGASNIKAHAVLRSIIHFNDRYGRTGTLFEDRFKSSPVETDAYLLTCLRYIELNPVRAGMVCNAGDYRWSSYMTHALGKKIDLWTPHPTYLALGANKQARAEAYRRLAGEDLDRDTITEIRRCANKGLILGTEKFRRQFEKLTGSPPTA